MAEKRMFTMKIIDSDAFLDMPLSTQSLYFHLNMRADDDGFVNNPKKIQRMIGSSDDDLKLLIAKRFIIAFENGVIVIKHWRMHNLLRKDRYKPTLYQDEKKSLAIKENGAYTERINVIKTECLPDGNQTTTECLPMVDEMDAQDRLGKDRLGKISIENKGNAKRFVPPSIKEVKAYCQERENGIDPEHFIDYYTARNWELTKGRKVKDWKACIRTWERNGFNKNNKVGANGVKMTDQKTDILDEIL